MRKFFIFVVFLTVLQINAGAFWDDFYLKTKITPKKLLPSTLSLTLAPGESAELHADIIPKEAEAKIHWQISSAIATLKYDNERCTLKAVECGDATISAITSCGVSCDIKLIVTEKERKIYLEAKDTIRLGESAIIYARPYPTDSVSWRVDGIESSNVSFGGNLCRINPKKEGNVTVSATLDNITVSRTLRVLPAKSKELNLNDLSLVLAITGSILLIIVFIYWRKHDKKL